MTNNFDNQDKGFGGADKKEGGRRPRTRISSSSAYRSGTSKSYGDRQVIRDERSGGSSQPRRYDDGRGNSTRNSYDRNEGGYNRSRSNSYGNREGGYSNNRQGGSSYGNREGGYSNNRQGGSSYGSREGGYSNNRQGGSSYGSREGGYSNNRQGGSSYGSREGGYSNNRQGGYGNNRQGGYNNNRGGGYNQGGSYGRSFRDNDYDPNSKYSQRKQIEYKTQYIDFTKPMRLNKFLANAGICSRREADEFIQAGVVVVNDDVVKELGTKVVPATDKVLFHDQLVKSEKKVYILLNKPKDCVTTVEDTHSRMTVLDLVRNACSERIYPVGRLDRNTTGVLLITNDGDLTSKLTHPKYDKKKIYHAVLDKEITDEDMDKIAQGITLEDGDIKADAISFVKEGDRRQVGIEIHSGKNRIVRRIFDSIGYHVVRLDRVYFAGLTKKNLPRGRWRYLSEMEVAMLKMGSHE